MPQQSGRIPPPATVTKPWIACLAAFALCLINSASAGVDDFGELRIRPAGLDIRAASALVMDSSGGVLYAKGIHQQRPIASITKLMTALVVLGSGLPLDEPVTITEADRDRMRWSRSRLRIDRAATLPRGQMLAVALMSSDNRAAAALGRTAFPGGTPAFVEAMNQKAAMLGMSDSRFADPTGLDAGNVSTAADLVKLMSAASRYPLLRSITGAQSMLVAPYGNSDTLEYRNTNPLVRHPEWHVTLSKTGYIHEAGRCLVMRARIADRELDIVLLGAQGKLTPVGDSNRLRDWLEARRPPLTAKVHSCYGSRDPDCWE
jgi:D-alanyl-D-alanine endopeptidase (penicillin-binding protein 7)